MNRPPTLKEIMHFFLRIQETKDLEQAFMKGYLMAMGGEQVLINSVESINWELMKKNPKRWADIERDTIRIALNVARDKYKEAIELGAELGVQSLKWKEVK